MHQPAHKSSDLVGYTVGNRVELSKLKRLIFASGGLSQSRRRRRRGCGVTVDPCGVGVFGQNGKHTFRAWHF